jgi:hypothetical protein
MPGAVRRSARTSAASRSERMSARRSPPVTC